MSLVRRNPLVAFFVLAFVISWGAGSLVHSIEPIRPAAPNWVLPAGPLLAALIVAAVADGREGVADLVRRALRWRVGLRWYAAALGLPVAMALAVVLLNGPLGGSAADWSRRPAATSALLLFAFFMVLPLATPVGEEWGWRGFALPRLLARFSPLGASLVLGVLWALWHLPVVADDPGLRTPVPFMLGVIVQSVLFTWLFRGTGGSVFIAVLFHAWYDSVLMYVVAILPEVEIATLWWLLLALNGAAAAAVVVAGGVGPGREPAPARPAP